MGADSTRAPDGATTFTNKDDATLIAAWDRRLAAFNALQELPNRPQGEGETPERDAQWSIVDAAETEIQAAIACTPRGAELQLWASSIYMFDSAEDEAPCYRADYDYFAAKGDALDWRERLWLAGIGSLRAQQEAEAAFAAAWLKSWVKDGGSVVIDTDGKAQIGWVCYDLSPAFVEPHPTWPSEVRETNALFNAAHHDATMKARYEALRMVPGGADMLKAHMRAEGIRVAVSNREQDK